MKEFQKSLPIKVLGVGSNTLIRNGGYEGIIIKLGKNFSHLSRLDEDTVIAGSAAFDKQVSNFALENSISGLEFLYCIPGSVGGAIKMNSGCYGYDISKCIKSIQVLDHNGIVRTIRSENINFFYRGTNLSDDLIFLSGTFKGEQQDVKIIKKKMEKFSEFKQKTQPSKIKTCGSTFKNLENKKAWELIKETNCDKLSVGYAKISEKHCNFFVNEKGKANSQDIEKLIETVQKEVFKKTKINLELEIKVIGKN